MVFCLLRSISLLTALTLWTPHLPSRMMVNTTIFAVGLVLQCALVFAAFWKGVSRRFPFFTLLMLFYPLRASLLFALAGRVDTDAYNSVFNTLTLVEFPLQVFAAAELALRWITEAGGWTRRRIVELLVLLAVVCGLTTLALHIITEPQLTDRVQICISFLMLALFAAIAIRVRTRNLLCISAGFAAFALVQLATLAGKARAMALHSGEAYVGWSYVPACGYLAVVIFWLIALQREPKA